MADVVELTDIDSSSKPLDRWFTNTCTCTNEELEGLDTSVPHLWATTDGITGNFDNWVQVLEAQTIAILVPVPDDGKEGGTFEDIVECIGKDKITVVSEEQTEEK
jgi:hypothetical protein